MQKWVKALRSGKYKQGFCQLRRGDSYCCLGVLCEVLKVPKKQHRVERGFSVGRGYSYGTSDYSHAGQLPGVAMELSGIKSEFGSIRFPKGVISLATLNDNRKRSFKHIAAYIERNWEKL